MTHPGQDGRWPQPYGNQPYGAYQPTGGPYAAGQQQPYRPQQGLYYRQPTAEFPAPPSSPPPNDKRGVIIGLVVALVALLGGGATWWALSQSHAATGAATPTLAARSLATSMGNGDVVGLLNTLAPAEAALFTDPVKATTVELKRLQILRADADPAAPTGIQLKAENLVFDEAQAQRINDHLTITKLTGGTLTVTADMSKLPLAKDFLDAAIPKSAQREIEQGSLTKTVDIGEQVHKGRQPIRIATVSVGGEWYPSLLYSIADYALLDAHQAWPQESIPAKGANSPNEAVRELAQAALDADVRRVIELLPPDEMGVLHDAGPAILKAMKTRPKPSGAKITKLETNNSTDAGRTRATLTALDVQAPDGDSFSMTKDGNCYRTTYHGESQQLCAGQLADRIAAEGRAKTLPADVKQVLRNLGNGVLSQGFGVITTEVDGKHYVSPIRSIMEQGMTVLHSLQPEDIKALLHTAN